MRTYRPATMDDLPRLLELSKQSRMRVNRVPSLTWVAEEDGVLCAALGLDWEQGMTVAGPLMVDRSLGRKPWMILRLVETMERWMTEAGGTEYLFGVACANKRWNAIAKKFAVRYVTKDGRHWYLRRLTEHGDGRSKR